MISSFSYWSGKSRAVRRRRSPRRSRGSSGGDDRIKLGRESLARTIPRCLVSEKRKKKEKETRRDISDTREIPSSLPHQYPKYFPSSGTSYWLTDARDARSRACLKAVPGEIDCCPGCVEPRVRVLRRDTRKIDASFFPRYKGIQLPGECSRIRASFNVFKP